MKDRSLVHMATMVILCDLGNVTEDINKMMVNQTPADSEDVITISNEGTNLIKGELGTIDHFHIIDAPPFLVPEPVPWICTDLCWREPLPRPPKTKLKIKGAPQQSFRSRMRSVNRNR